MESVYIVIVALLVVALVGWRFRSGPSRQMQPGQDATAVIGAAKRSQTGPSLPRKRYPAKTLRICNDPCRAALKLRDHSFLAAEAPPLPLPGCDHACHCRYSSHGDRRLKTDRRYPSANLASDSDSLLLPDSAVTPDDARSGDDRRHRRIGAS